MKKIMLIIISVITLFTACKESSIEQTEQVNYEESFNGITFGMTKEEVIAVLGRAPDYDFESDIEYDKQVFLNVTADIINYGFNENGNLDSIRVMTLYEWAKEQMKIDLDHIKDELLKYYPENTLTRIEEVDNELFLFTENRMICLKTYDDAFDVYIAIRD